MTLALLELRLAVCQLPSRALPSPVGEFFSVTQTSRELSVVLEERYAPEDARVEGGWRCFEVAGPLAFSEVGVLSALAAPLAEADISIFALSTFDTDYLLLKEANLSEASRVLKAAGHTLKGHTLKGEQ